MTHLHKNSYFSFIVNSRIVVRASDERAWHPLKENDAILKKNMRNCRKITFLLTTSALLPVELCFAYQVKGIDVL